MPSPFPALCELTNVVDDRSRHQSRQRRRSILTISSKYYSATIDIAIYILRFITTIKIIRIIITITIIIIIIIATITIVIIIDIFLLRTKEVEYVGIRMHREYIHIHSQLHTRASARRLKMDKFEGRAKNRDERASSASETSSKFFSRSRCVRQTVFVARTES